MLIRLIILGALFIPVHHAGLKEFLRRALAPVMDLSETVLGETVAASVALQYGGEWNENPAVTAWATSIFNRVVANAERTGINWKFKVVNANYVNAFAVPGGHIFVTSGLVKKVRSDDELAAVLGHEIGHVVGRHSMNSLEHQLIWHLIAEQIRKKNHKEIATIMQVYGLFRGMRYSRQNEQEADIYGARYADMAGFNPLGMQHFLETINSESEPDPGRIGIAFMSHPPTNRRIEYAMNLQAQFSQEALSRPLRLSRPQSGIGTSKSIGSIPLPWQTLHTLEWVPTISKLGIAEALTPVGSFGLYALELAEDRLWQKVESIRANKEVCLQTTPLLIPPAKSLQVEIPVRDFLTQDSKQCFLRVLIRDQKQVLLQSAETRCAQEKDLLTLEVPAYPNAHQVVVQFGISNSRGKAFFGPLNIRIR